MMRGTLATLARHRAAGAHDAATAARGRTAVVGIVAALILSVGIANVYVPFYSTAAERARQRSSKPAAETAKPTSEPSLERAADSENVPGSMWRAMTDRHK